MWEYVHEWMNGILQPITPGGSHKECMHKIRGIVIYV